MSETVIESVLTGKLDSTLLLKWLNNESLEDSPEECILHCCNRNEFVTCFLSFIRQQTDSIIQTNTNAVQILQHSTPEKLLTTRRKHHRSVSDPTSDDRTLDSLIVNADHQRSHESPSRDRKRTGRRVKTKLFNEDRSINQSISSDESRLSIGIDKLIISSTPIKNGIKANEYPNVPLTSPVTPKSFVREQYERCDTPRLSHRHSKSHEKSCLGDYMVNVTKSAKKKKSGRSSTDNEDSKQEIDLSNSEMFPEIGARKASSLRSEKRRIKPTNIDKSQKSVSLSSFSAESIHTSPLIQQENSAFKQQKVLLKENNSFEVERNILKQERHKLMEKFNILNTSAPQKVATTPQIKVTQKNSIEKCPNYVKSDVSKITFKDNVDLLVNIYNILLKNHLIMSIHTEIYFLILILISKQYEDDYIAAEKNLNEQNMNYILKSIHNSTYFAVKSLWHQRLILEVILDKSSLKTLGENKKVRSFYPDLAKFLLNCYGLRCEADSQIERRHEPQANGVICFNSETDNVDNFPSMLSFQNFKKQRDMFYEIFRWYQDTSGTGVSTSFRSRVKALLCCGANATNHSHLANLFTQHMIAHCLPTDRQESKLSKLQRRLTCPNAPESQRLPNFATQEMFYKDFIINAENESFRVHLRDVLATEIVSLDAALITPDDRTNSNTNITIEYLILSKKLRLLAKFLGLITSLPYTLVITEYNNKNHISKTVQRDLNYAPPKEKVLENDIALRNYTQPTIDLKGMLHNANETGRLTITIPWIIHYLSMLDYTSLRLIYYQNILKILFDIYTNRLKTTDVYFKKNTIIYLKCILGWLFDLPHFPQDLFYENRVETSVGVDISIDSLDLIDESSLIELCPHLKDLNILLLTCKVSEEQKGSFRHITPVSLSLNNEDRVKNKEKELQSRLEEEFLKSQPSSTRRVLEVVIERITSAVVRELNAHVLVEARQRARQKAHNLLASTQPNLEQIQSLYSEEVQRLRTTAIDIARGSILSRAKSAVSALLTTAPPPLVSLVVKGSMSRLSKWVHDNWNSTAILCKDIESEVKSFTSVEVTSTGSKSCDVTAMMSSDHVFNSNNVSPAACLIALKEQVCLLLEGVEPTDLSVLSTCVVACSPNNIFVRPPTTKAILQLSLDLCIVYVSRKPTEITESFLNKLHAIWNVCCPDRKRSPPLEITLPERRGEISPEFRNFDDDEDMVTPISDEENNDPESQVVVTKITNATVNNPIATNSTVKSPTSTHFTVKSPTSTHFAVKSPMSSNATVKSSTSTNVTVKNTTSVNYTVKSPTSTNLALKSPTATVNISVKKPKSPTSPNFTVTSPNPTNFTVKSPAFTNFTVKSLSNIIITQNNSEKSIINENEENNEYLEFFDRILCPRNIMLLSVNKCKQVWEGMATVLVFMLQNDYLREDSLTEQCLAVYRQDWPQNVLENLSICMKSVSSRWARSSTGKFNLFLDFLAEYCGDMDYEPLDDSLDCY